MSKKYKEPTSSNKCSALNLEEDVIQTESQNLTKLFPQISGFSRALMLIIFAATLYIVIISYVE